METINDRVRYVVEHSHLRKTEVAKLIGISDSSLSTICSGKSNPSNQTIMLIVKELGPNEHWLRTGEGDPFPPPSREEEIGQIALEASKENIDEAVAFFKEWFGDLTDAEILTLYRIWKRKKQREKQK